EFGRARLVEVAHGDAGDLEADAGARLDVVGLAGQQTDERAADVAAPEQTHAHGIAHKLPRLVSRSAVPRRFGDGRCGAPESATRCRRRATTATRAPAPNRTGTRSRY